MLPASLDFQAAGSPVRYSYDKLERILLATVGNIVVVQVVVVTHVHLVVVKLNDEVTIAHQRPQAHILLFDPRAHQQLQREQMFVVSFREITMHEIR